MGAEDNTIVGFAWYRRNQWPRLLQAADDASALEATYDEWHATATRLITDMQIRGTRVERVDLDVEKLIYWCNAKGCGIDANARAEYVSELLWLRDHGE